MSLLLGAGLAAGRGVLVSTFLKLFPFRIDSNNASIEAGGWGTGAGSDNAGHDQHSYGTFSYLEEVGAGSEVVVTLP